MYEFLMGVLFISGLAVCSAVLLSVQSKIDKWIDKRFGL